MRARYDFQFPSALPHLQLNMVISLVGILSLTHQREPLQFIKGQGRFQSLVNSPGKTFQDFLRPRYPCLRHRYQFLRNTACRLKTILQPWLACEAAASCRRFFGPSLAVALDT